MTKIPWSLNGVKISGRKCGRPLRPLSAEWRASVACWLIESGRVRTLIHAAAVVQLSTGYVSTMLRATEEECAALLCEEISLSQLHHKARSKPVTADEDVVRVIEEIGPDRVWAAFDTMMAPMMLEAVE